MVIQEESNFEEDLLPKAADEDAGSDFAATAETEADQPVHEQKEPVPGILEVIYGMFFSPVVTFAAIAKHSMVGRAVLFFLFVQLLSTVNGIAFIREQAPDLIGTGLTTVFPVMMMTMALIGWFLNAAVLQLLAEFLGGKGRGTALFATLGFAYAPALFSAPLTLLLSNVNPRMLNLTTFILTIWVMVLSVLAVRTVHGFSTGKAVWTLVIPFLSFLILSLGILIMSVLVIMGLGLEFPGMPGF
jgi:hypothetical protein